MKTKNLYGKGICQHCIELGIKEERARILKIIDNTRCLFCNGKCILSNDGIRNINIQELKAKIREVRIKA